MRVPIWDLPTRLFHWSLVLLIPFMWWTAEEERLDLHIAGGTGVLGLLMFRLLWGFLGSSTARFAGFVRGPGAVIGYLRGRRAYAVGHNPLGALSVIAMLGLLCLQVGLGLFASDDDGLESGPLAHLISSDLSEELAELHEDLFNVLLVLIGVHIAAILFYTLFKRQNLMGPMVSGTGEAPESVRGMQYASAWRFWLAAAVAALAAACIGGFI